MRGVGKLNHALRRTGYALAPAPLAGVVQQLRHHRVGCVLDVGAATGRYAVELRGLGYVGRIESFEPLRAPFETLRGAARGDPGWRVHNMALGDLEGTATINVAGNSDSSSLLPMLARHRLAAPYATYVGQETVRVARLEDLFGDLDLQTAQIFLKIDTQGFERQVLDGVGDLRRVAGLQVELSLAALYDGGMLYDEALAYLTGQGFALTDVVPGFRDVASGQLLQMDGVFFRPVG